MGSGSWKVAMLLLAAGENIGVEGCDVGTNSGASGLNLKPAELVDEDAEEEEGGATADEGWDWGAAADDDVGGGAVVEGCDADDDDDGGGAVGKDGWKSDRILS